MATITATSTNNWATAFPSVPTAADDVVIPSPYTVTIPSGYTAVCRSITVNSGGGWTIANSSTARINIGDGTAGAGNVAMSLDAGGSYNLTSGGGSGIITFISTSATQQTITTGGAALPTVTVNGSGSSYILGSAISWYATKNFTLTAGTFNTGNYSMSGAVLDLSGSTTRTFTPGSSTITLASSSTPLVVTGTNLTITSNTATIVATGTNPRLNSTLNMNGTSLTFSGNGIYSIGAGGTWNNITFTGGTDGLSLEGSLTATGTFTATGSSAANRIYVQSNTLGTARTFTAAAVSLTNVDFMDITGAGAASWTGTTLGDRQGNSGITFTTPATQTRDNTSGSAWSVAARWTSRVPLPQDDVVINGSSGNISSTDVLVLGKSIDFTGYTGTITHASNANIFLIFGGLTLGSGMSFGPSVSTFNLDFMGRSSYTITSNGKTMFPPNNNQAIRINAPGGTYTLADAFTQTSGPYTFQVIAGSFDSNSYSLSTGRFLSTGVVTRSTTLGSSTISLTATTALSVITLVSTGLTFSGANATFTIANTTANTRTIDTGRQTIGTLNYVLSGSTGQLTITGSSSISTLNFYDASNARTLAISAGVTLTVQGTFNVYGTSGKLVSIISGTAGTKAYISKPSGGPISTSLDYLSIQDIHMVQPLSFFVGANSTNVSNNNGIYFNTSPTYKHQQSIANVVTSTSITTSFTIATTAGNLLVAHVISSGTTGGSVVDPVGWTLAKTAGSAPTIYTYFKTATGSETSVAYSQATSRTLGMELIEYSGFSGTPTADVTDSNTGTNTALSTTATTGPTNTAQPAIALALVSGSSTLGSLVSATNSFSLDYTPGNASSVFHAAAKELTSLAAVDTTITWTTSRSAAIHLVVIKNVSGFSPKVIFFA